MTKTHRNMKKGKGKMTRKMRAGGLFDFFKKAEEVKPIDQNIVKGQTQIQKAKGFITNIPSVFKDKQTKETLKKERINKDILTNTLNELNKKATKSKNISDGNIKIYNREISSNENELDRYLELFSKNLKNLNRLIKRKLYLIGEIKKNKEDSENNEILLDYAKTGSFKSIEEIKKEIEKINNEIASEKKIIDNYKFSKSSEVDNTINSLETNLYDLDVVIEEENSKIFDEIKGDIKNKEFEDDFENDEEGFKIITPEPIPYCKKGEEPTIDNCKSLPPMPSKPLPIPTSTYLSQGGKKHPKKSNKKSHKK